MLGIHDRVATIESGKEVDLLVLDENPLKNIGNTQSIHAVISKGRYLDKDWIKANQKNK